MGEAPLPEIHRAAAAGELGKVQELVDEDDNLLDALDTKKRTPVMMAVINGQTTVGSMREEGRCDRV